MTQEEKAKAYDGALERARKMLNMILDNELLGFPDQIREIFPQLKESKEEKIREEMIRYFTEMKKGGSASLPYDDCIAYLKQKEYKLTEEDKKIIPEALVMLCDDIINHRVHTPIKTDEEGARKIKAFLKTFNRQPHKTREEWEKQKEQTDTEKEYIRTLKSLISDFLHGKQEIDTGYYQRICDWLDGRHIEQKVLPGFDGLTPEEKMNHPLYLEGFDVGRDVQKVFDEQKPEWSEEDEKKINFLSRLIEFQVKDDEYCFSEGRFVSKQEAIEMLKSLRPQPKQEWSEDDEERLKAICTYLQDYPRLAKINDVKRFNEYCDWLKSLPLKLEKQKEQKPVHFELKAGKWYICHRAFCCRADHLTVKEGERFQCEKDGIVKGFVIKEPEKYFKECSAPAPMEDEQKEQKPAEWSEKDADILNCCISSIEEAKENRYAYKETDGDTSYDREIDWLKSLSPSWKPSEEQMEWLKSAVRLSTNKPHIHGIIISLYEQLKRL